jgi:hypothetical protein
LAKTPSSGRKRRKASALAEGSVGLIRQSATLYITNGDSAAGTMREAGFQGEILPWRDILHEGPVPGGLPLPELSRVRARFLADKGWADAATVFADFEARDRALLSAGAFDRVALWFEHDLYDQLQLLQLLAWFAENRGAAALQMLFIDGYPGMPRFGGLGELDANQLSGLRGSERAVAEEQLDLGRLGFEAFTSETPERMIVFIERDLTALPYLPAALERLLEEYPALGDGLARSQRQLLSAIGPCRGDLGEMFAFCAKAEQARYLGDIAFLDYASVLAAPPQPALRFESVDPKSGGREARWQRRVSLTPFGERLLAGEADFISANGIDRWIGGVHLTGGDWRYDRQARRLARST